MSSTVPATAFAILGVTALAVAAVHPPLRLPGLGLGFIFLFLSASTFSKANQIRGSLQPLVKTLLRVEVWGLPLPDREAIFVVDSISSFGAGLLIQLRAPSGGPRALLKVAQPGLAGMHQGRIEIRDAAYVSWRGQKLKPAAATGKPALILTTAVRL